MPRKKETITLSIPPGTKEQLEAIARHLNITWGKEPSISGLIVAIAQQSVEVGKPFTLDSNQVNALQQAIKTLNDAGHIGEAETVIALLLERGNLEAPLRQLLMKQLSQPIQEWRSRIEELIKAKQPFYLLYQDSQGRELDYKVRHAEVQFFDKRFYLMIWCEETADVEDDIPELPELWHNRCLSFDRIKSVVSTSGDWRGELDYVKVQLHFRSRLAKAYQPKENDIEDDMINDVRQVVRQVANPFWLIREVSPYWEDCVIVSPESLRDRLKQKLLTLCQLYDIETKS
ncbi:helix-turn-helix transcriptional regulator [Nostoc sp. 'Lobaria pulmonaria (5183) cyanobiont']|uniref:helix-turn-helix transcriptional regulator n=1 Tax=Nostoc sp. 'Lobaria pulmonaria (5183) cyanobiont' TaxID=1618022 RepID=UPI000CF34F01|nr:WYL domain-containing protein [Nostoc sp. 'Lobaria pulmonaria (5183) cyanobiont']AVH69591.1 WYL domain-containing protein [Nostoc sp. 'Lobaria pulmonaria (5183) cyanobiont']